MEGWRKERALVRALLNSLQEGIKREGFRVEPTWRWAETHVWLILREEEIGDVWILKDLKWWREYRDGHPDERGMMMKELLRECRMRLSVRSRKVLGPGH
jgi:hypothetical protein